MIKIGIELPQTGASTTPEKILDTARRAEAGGLSSVSVFDRLLVPTAPVEHADGTRRELPAHYRVLYDPVITLTAVAAVTTRIELVTEVLDILFHPPVVLARQLAALDQISHGRLVLGVGQGWMQQEFDIANVPIRRRGAGFDEHVAAMRGVWSADPVRFKGRFYEIPESYIGPKPARPGGPPVLAGTSNPAVLKRIAAWADGLLPVIATGATWEQLQEVLGAFLDAYPPDRPAPDIRLRAHTRITDRPIEGNRMPASGNVEQVVEDLARLSTLGVTEICLNQTLAGVPHHEQLSCAIAVHEALG